MPRFVEIHTRKVKKDDGFALMRDTVGSEAIERGSVILFGDVDLSRAGQVEILALLNRPPARARGPPRQPKRSHKKPPR